MQRLVIKKTTAFVALTLILLSVVTACGDSPPTASSSINPTAGPTINSTVQALLTQAPTPGSPVKLPESTLPSVKNNTAKLVGPVDSTALITFNIALKLDPAKQAELQKAITAASDPKNKQNDKFINNDQFLQKYAPSEDQVRAVQAYMAKNGIELLSVTKNRLSATFRAPAQLIQDTFKVKMNRYQEARIVTAPAAGSSPENQTPPQESEPQMPVNNPNSTPNATAPASNQTQTIDFYANDSDVTVPQNYLPYIQAVTLNNYPVEASNRLSQSSGRPTGYSPNQLKAAYNIAPLAKAGLDGSGQTIAVFGFGGYKRSDIDTFTKAFNLPNADIEDVLINGADGKVGSSSGEVELDLEVVVSIAPKAKILYYEAPVATNLRNWADTLNAIVADGRAQIISISYGLCELAWEQSDLQAFDSIFAQARAEGITIFTSTGDRGAFDCSKLDKSLVNTPVAHFPSSDRYTTAVGGTSLVLKGGQYGAEAAWSDPEDRPASGGGGGISILFPLQDYQKDFVVKSLNTKGARQTPDVSGDADPRTGYAYYCTISKEICGPIGWGVIGGTSASTPMWAGATALVNQYLNSKFPGAGALLIGPDYLYLLQQAFTAGVIKGAPFHDVIQGDNLYYKASKGYDLATGLGTPDFLNITLGIEELYRQASS